MIFVPDRVILLKKSLNRLSFKRKAVSLPLLCKNRWVSQDRLTQILIPVRTIQINLKSNRNQPYQFGEKTTSKTEHIEHKALEGNSTTGIIKTNKECRTKNVESYNKECNYVPNPVLKQGVSESIPCINNSLYIYWSVQTKYSDDCTKPQEGDRKLASSFVQSERINNYRLIPQEDSVNLGKFSSQTNLAKMYYGCTPREGATILCTYLSQSQLSKLYYGCTPRECAFNLMHRIEPITIEQTVLWMLATRGRRYFMHRIEPITIEQTVLWMLSTRGRGYFMHRIEPIRINQTVLWMFATRGRSYFMDKREPIRSEMLYSILVQNF